MVIIFRSETLLRAIATQRCGPVALGPRAFGVRTPLNTFGDATLTRFVAGVLMVVAVPACSVIASSIAHADPVATTATVLKVVDRDTVDIVDDVRGRLRIRLLGIDTPETKKPGYTVGCWGPQASEFAKSTLLGQRVAFVTDPSQGMQDRYGRNLAYLDKADGWDYSVEAARAGAAHSYVYHNHPAARADEIAAAEQEAKAAWPGTVGTAVLGPNDISTNLIRRGSFAQRSGRAGGPSVGAQYLRDGDVVVLEFTGVAGGGAVYGWG